LSKGAQAATQSHAFAAESPVAKGRSTVKKARRDDLTEAIRAVPLNYLVEVLTGQEVPPSGAMRCLLHGDRDPSLKLYDDGHFHCFGCQAHGSAFDLAAALWGLDVRRDFVEIRNRLADELLAGGAA
jgi:DNA primase